MTPAKLWIISGPSAVGKGTVCARLRSLYKELFFAVSWTTRAPRPGERAGVDYEFVDDATFDHLISSQELLEWAIVHGKHRYGTPRSSVVDALTNGQHVILEIDLQGARQVKQHMPEAQLVFLMPPSWEELVHRLSGRATETAEQQQRRLETAKEELLCVDEADHVIVNNTVEDTVQALVTLLELPEN